MVDLKETGLQKTRVRSGAASKYAFQFLPTYERAVFPIMQRNAAGVSILAGTGFFIAPNGIFASAAHVFEVDVNEGDSFWIAHCTNNNSIVELDIGKVKIRPKGKDIAIGKISLEGEHHPIVSIMEITPETNEVIGTFVFSQTLVHKPIKSDDHQIQLIKYRNHWEIGLAEETSTDGFWQTPGLAFSASVFVEGRASGGPMFNSNGFVVGINCSGLAPEDGLPFSKSTSLKDISNLEIDGISIGDRRKGLPNKPIAKLVKK